MEEAALVLINALAVVLINVWVDAVHVQVVAQAVQVAEVDVQALVQVDVKVVALDALEHALEHALIIVMDVLVALVAHQVVMGALVVQEIAIPDAVTHVLVTVQQHVQQLVVVNRLLQ